MEGKSYLEFFIFKMKTESRSDKHVEKSYYRKIILQKSIMCHFFQCMKMERNTPLRVTKYSLQLSQESQQQQKSPNRIYFILKITSLMHTYCEFFKKKKSPENETTKSKGHNYKPLNKESTEEQFWES